MAELTAIAGFSVGFLAFVISCCCAVWIILHVMKKKRFGIVEKYDNFGLFEGGSNSAPTNRVVY